jgi:hypothetical protein
MQHCNLLHTHDTPPTSLVIMYVYALSACLSYWEPSHDIRGQALILQPPIVVTLHMPRFITQPRSKFISLVWSLATHWMHECQL